MNLPVSYLSTTVKNICEISNEYNPQTCEGNYHADDGPKDGTPNILQKLDGKK
jgi:hypothetical protein